MKLLEIGTYTFKGLFMIVDQGLLNQKLQPKQEEFGTFEIELHQEADINDVINKNIMELNQYLPKFLKFKNIKRWIPYRTSSYDIEGNVISVGYYHDQIMYDIIYKTQYTIEPIGIYPQLIGNYYNEIIYDKIYTPICLYPEPNRYYGIYGLDIYAKEIYIDQEEASITFNNIIKKVLDNYDLFSNNITYLNY